MSAAREAACAVHGALWRRFFPGGRGVMVDYAEGDGSTLLPTVEDHALGRPNALGWWSAAENGPFYTGLYLHGLMDRLENEAAPDVDLASRAGRLAEGLCALALPHQPGFIARGLGPDGASHYRCSSSDQTFPWFLGLWRYASSPAVAVDARNRATKILLRAAEGLHAAHWRLHCDPPAFGHFGDLSGEPMTGDGDARGEEPAFDATTRFLFICKACASLSGDPAWHERYRTALRAPSAVGGRTRLEILEEGAHYVEPGAPPRYPVSTNLWTSASSQAGLEALMMMEEDAAIKRRMRRGMRLNAERALPYLDLYSVFDLGRRRPVCADWRPLNKLWKPQKNSEEAVAVATGQYKAWHEDLSPGKHDESLWVRDPLFAAWVACLGADEALRARLRPMLEKMVAHYPYDELFSASFFMAENVAARLR